MSFAASAASVTDRLRDATEREAEQVPLVVSRYVIETRCVLDQLADRCGERGRRRRDAVHQRHQLRRPSDALRQRADARIDLIEPLQRSAQSQSIGEVLLRLVGQMVRFVEDVDGVGRIGQHRATAEREIGKHEVEVRDHDVGFLEPAARFEERTLTEESAAVAGTAAVVRGDAAPVRLIDAVRPAVDVAVPRTPSERAQQALVQHARIAGHRFEHRERVLRIAAQAIVEPLEANVTLASLRQRETELESGARARGPADRATRSVPATRRLRLR